MNQHPSEPTGQHPEAMPEGWIEVDGKVYIPVEEASQLAANQCLHGIHGDDWGNPYCPKIKDQDKRIAELEALCNTFIESLQIMKPLVNVGFQDTIDLAIAKAKDKLHGNGKA